MSMHNGIWWYAEKYMEGWQISMSASVSERQGCHGHRLKHSVQVFFLCPSFLYERGSMRWRHATRARVAPLGGGRYRWPPAGNRHGCFHISRFSTKSYLDNYKCWHQFLKYAQFQTKVRNNELAAYHDLRQPRVKDELEVNIELRSMTVPMVRAVSYCSR